jgi:hypothetical protein
MTVKTLLNDNSQMGKDLKKDIKETETRNMKDLKKGEKHTIKTDVSAVKDTISKVDMKATAGAIRDFVNATALLVTSVFTGIVAYAHYTNNAFGWFYIGCAILIGLQGAYLLGRNFLRSK